MPKFFRRGSVDKNGVERKPHVVERHSNVVSSATTARQDFSSANLQSLANVSPFNEDRSAGRFCTECGGPSNHHTDRHREFDVRTYIGSDLDAGQPWEGIAKVRVRPQPWRDNPGFSVQGHLTRDRDGQQIFPSNYEARDAVLKELGGDTEGIEYNGDSAKFDMWVETPQDAERVATAVANVMERNRTQNT